MNSTLRNIRAERLSDQNWSESELKSQRSQQLSPYMSPRSQKSELSPRMTTHESFDALKR